MTAHLETAIAPWGDPARVCDALRGVWSLSRQISDGSAMAGTAVFALAAGGSLAYREHGTLRRADGASFEAERRYLFRPRPDGFVVLFAEAPPRLFQDIVLAPVDGVLAGDATHLCAADAYASRYIFRPDGSFSIRHAVRGPRKAYWLDTLYRRVAAAPG